MNKTTAILLIVGAVGVGGYFYWKSQQPVPKAFGSRGSKNTGSFAAGSQSIPLGNIGGQKSGVSMQLDVGKFSKDFGNFLSGIFHPSGFTETEVIAPTQTTQYTPNASTSST